MPIGVPSPVPLQSFEHALDLASRSPDVTAVADALSALHKVVSLDGQPAGTLARVIEVARLRMTTTDSVMVWQVAVDLALATGDRTLRAIVVQVAAGVIEPPFSAPQDLSLWVRNAAQRALNRTPAG